MSSVFMTRVRAIPRYAKTTLVRYFPAPSIARDPSNPLAWIAASNKMLESLPSGTRTLIRNHNLRPDTHELVVFADDIRAAAGSALKRLADKGVSPDTVSEAINEIIRYKTVAQCAYAHRAGLYFEHAEPHMAKQWNGIIWPIIKDEDFTNTLELACGHGRNTEFLRRLARMIDLVDVNQNCIEACRQRFGQEKDGCAFRYHVTSGTVLPVGDETISFGYSWDSMVHFDKLVVQDYVREFARVLKPGGTAFLHHSNYGEVAPDSDWAKNHGNRSDMTASLMRDYARQSGLSMKFQRLSGLADGWGIDDLDCLSLLQKPL